MSPPPKGAPLLPTGFLHWTAPTESSTARTGLLLFNPVTKAFRQQRRLPAIRPLNEAPHLIPPRITQESYRKNQIQQRVLLLGNPRGSRLLKPEYIPTFLAAWKMLKETVLAFGH
jgi:hypothetical protein